MQQVSKGIIIRNIQFTIGILNNTNNLRTLSAIKTALREKRPILQKDDF